MTLSIDVLLSKVPLSLCDISPTGPHSGGAVPPRRHELYPGYKGQRSPMPDEIREALPRLYEMMQLMVGAQPRPQ